MNDNDRTITGFTMLGHATFHSYELAIPIFVVIWSDTFSPSPATLGLIVGASYALTGIGALPGGILADAYSSRTLVLGCIAGMVLGFTIVSVASTLVVLTVGLLVWGAAGSLYHPAALALISRGTVNRSTAFGYHGVAGNVGVAIGPLLAAVLLAVLPWRIVAVALGVPVAIAFVAALRLDFDEKAGAEARSTSQSDDRLSGAPTDFRSFLGASKMLFVGGFLLVFLIGNLYGVFIRGAFTFLPKVLAALDWLAPAEMWGRTIEPSQYVYSGLLLFGGVGQYIGGKLSVKYRTEYVLVTAFVALMVTALLFVPAGRAGVVPLLIVASLLVFLVFVISPINQEVLSKYVPTSVRGISFGYSYLAVFGVGALGAAIAGIILTRWTSTELFLFEAALAAAAGIIGLYLIRYEANQPRRN